MQFPSASVIGFLMVYFEGEALAECNHGQSFKPKTQTKKSEMGSDKELAAMDLCGKAKNVLCLLS